MRASALAVAALLWSWPGSAAPADAPEPETRAAQWTRLRAEKAARTAEPRPGFLERALLAVEQSKRPSLFGLRVAGFHPRVHDIASGSETAAGLRFWPPDVGGSRVDVHASAFYSIRGYEYYDLQVGRVAHEGDGLPNRSIRGDDVYEMGDAGRLTAGRAIAYGSVRYRHYPETAFYGLGAAARADGRTTFLSQDALYEVVAGYEGPHGAATVRGGLLQAFVGPGTEDDVPPIRARYDDRSAPGLDGQPDFIHLAATLLRDGRDRPGNPHRGGMIAAGAELTIEDGSLRFRNLGAEARLGRAEGYDVEWSVFENATGGRTGMEAQFHGASFPGPPAVPIPHTTAGFLVARIRTRSANHPAWAGPVTVYLARGPEWHVVGVDRQP